MLTLATKIGKCLNAKNELEIANILTDWLYIITNPSDLSNFIYEFFKSFWLTQPIFNLFHLNEKQVII
jgi:hypothetical protein